MPKTRQNIVERAKKRGYDRDSGIASSKKILSRLEDGTLRNHQSQLAAWEDYVNNEMNETGREPSAYNLEDLERFMEIRAEAIHGVDDLPPGQESVRNYWNNFTGAWRRKHPSIPKDIAESVTEFIYGPLTDKLGLLAEKRPRRFANENHLLLYAEQLWARDWFVYQKPETRVNDWGLHLSNVFIKGNVQILPRHALTEGKDPSLLCFNSLLPFLSKFLEMKVFRDHQTIEDLLAIEPPKHARACHVRWKDEILETPFFISQSTTRVSRIETASEFSRRIASLGIRTGMPKPPTQHDWRIGSRTNKIPHEDKYYSESARMRQAGHHDSNTFRNYYQPSNSGVDGQGTFLGKERREIISDVFRELSIPYNPNLSQRLPARERYILEHSEEDVSLETETASLVGNGDSQSKERPLGIQQNRCSILRKALKKWWARQTYNPDDPPEYHRGLFDRVRFMMPERDRLARNLFQIATLRDPVGLSVLRDMMALLRQVSEVEFRPGLEPEKCRCPKKKAHRDDSICENSRRYDWKHIYDCYKQDSSSVYGFADLCFLCSTWVYGEQEWIDHCRDHVGDLSTFPTYWAPILHGGVLAAPGYCPFCLTTKPEPHKKMHQFLFRKPWSDHIQRHIDDLKRSEAQKKLISIKCPLPTSQCPRDFDCVLELEFHLQDVHIGDMPKPSRKRKRSREEEDKVEPDVRTSRKQQRSAKKRDFPEDHVFIITTKDAMVKRTQKSSKPRLSHPSSSSDTTATTSSEDLCSVKSSRSPTPDTSLIDPQILFESNISASPTLDPTAATEPASIEGDVFTSASSVVKDTCNPRGSHVSTVTNTIAGYSANAEHLKIRRHRTSPESPCHELLSPKRLELDFTGNEEALVSACSSIAATQTPSGFDHAYPVSHDLEPFAVDPDDRQYLVERLLRRRVRKIGKRKKVQYLVKWEGYPESRNEWVNEADINDDLVEAFMEEQRTNNSRR
ncbi:putative carbonic anhydrase 2 [Phaeomoniella chlamydospora]|uniref:Putative carbonic anhydrase 2 n=1 Tax=Phaeomoniella chlamydospora TaxID=158046 RepID=A0A0G2EIK4_PHACM|nr:putative carbonic anhydrase 2 [Phaeomoniella chlamydospora]